MYKDAVCSVKYVKIYIWSPGLGLCLSTMVDDVEFFVSVAPLSTPQLRPDPVFSFHYFKIKALDIYTMYQKGTQVNPEHFGKNPSFMWKGSVVLVALLTLPELSYQQEAVDCLSFFLFRSVFFSSLASRPQRRLCFFVSSCLCLLFIATNTHTRWDCLCPWSSVLEQQQLQGRPGALWPLHAQRH